MSDHSRDIVLPYQPLVTFANAQIEQDNWKEVLAKLNPLPRKDPRQKREQQPKPYLGLGGPMRLSLGKKKITGPRRLQELQYELREDFTLLTVSNSDKDLSWLEGKLRGDPSPFTTPSRPPLEMTIPMSFEVYPTRGYDDEIRLPTDPAHLIPAIEDVRVRVYWLLANLWVDGLLPRLGRCQNCSCFFLARTRAKKRFCSQPCAQNLTRSARAKKTREHRAAWQKKRERLLSISNDMIAIEQRRKILPPRSERQVLEEAEEVWKAADAAFTDAYRRKNGPGFAAGKRFLAKAQEQILRLRKKVKDH